MCFFKFNLSRIFFLSITAITMNCGLRAEEDQNKLTRSATPGQDHLQAVTLGINDLGFDLYKQLASQHKNIFFSPYSISTALAITYVGARDSTQLEMRNVLHVAVTDEGLNEGFSRLNKFLISGNVSASFGMPQIFQANSLWLQKNLRVLPGFQTAVNNYWKGSFKQVDFRSSPESARSMINSWVMERTQSRIADILQSGDVVSDTRLVIVSAIFMKAFWEHPFESNVTKFAPFFKDDQSTISVAMMNHIGSFPYRRLNDFDLLELPYISRKSFGPRLAMYILLPHRVDGISLEETIFTGNKWADLIKGLENKRVSVSLPKFKLEESLHLSEVLKSLGMAEAFAKNADFSGITGRKDLSISSVVHKAFISVDEGGTEAAAATSISMNVTAIREPAEPIIFNADHPFIFIIVEKTTQTILFMGRLISP